MTAVVSTLGVVMDLDSTGFERGLNNVRDKLQDTGRRLQAIGGIMTATVTAPIVGGLGYAVTAASDLNESISKTGVVFGDSAADILAWSEDSATSLLISQNAALGFASTFGNIFTSLGFTADEAANMSMGFVQLGADLASFNNVGTDEALNAIRSGLLGEYEPLKNLGIVLSEAEVEAKALEMQLAATGSELTQQDKILARQALIMERSTNAQGDAARTSAGFANQIRILQARLTNAAAAIGQILLPYVTRLVSFISNLIGRFEKMSDSAKRVVVVIALIAAAIGPLLVVIGTLAVAAGTVVGNWANIVKVMKAVRAATLSSLGPLLLVVAVIAGLYFIWTRDLFGIRSKITAWFDAFKAGGGVERLKARFESFKKTVLDLAGRALTKLVEVFHRIVDAVKGPATKAFALLQQAMVHVVAAVAMVVGGIVSRLDPLKSAFFGVVQMVTSFVGIITSLFEGDLRGALDNAMSLFEGYLQYLSGLGEFIFSILSGALGHIWTALAAVNWAAVGSTLLTYLEVALGELGVLASRMADKAEEMVNGFVAWVVAYNWVGLGRTMLALIGSALLAIGELVEKLEPHAEELVQGFVDWIVAYDWIGLGKTIFGLVVNAVSAVGSLTLLLAGKGRELLYGLKDNARTAWESVGKPWFASLPSKIVAGVGDLYGTLRQKATQLMNGFRTQLPVAWELIKPWLKGLGVLIVNAVGDLYPTLQQKATQLMNGFRTRLISAWDDVANWFGGLDDKIKGFFSNGATWLKEAGRSIIQGVWDGMTEKWDSVLEWGGGLADAFRSVKGPLDYDKVLLVPEGRAIIDGLLKGMQAAYPSVERFLSGATADIASTAFVAPTVAGMSNLSGMATGAITINVSGAGDPGRVADEVYRRFSQELGLRGAL